MSCAGSRKQAPSGSARPISTSSRRASSERVLLMASLRAHSASSTSAAARGSGSAVAVAVVAGRALRAGNRLYRRFGPGARGIQPARGIEADARACRYQRRRAGLPHARLRFNLRVERRGRGARALGDRGRGSRRQLQPLPSPGPADWTTSALRIGGPREPRLTPGSEYAIEFTRALNHARELGHVLVPMDFDVLHRTANLLYSGPWVAERHHVVKDLLESNPEALDPTVRAVVGSATRSSARRTRSPRNTS